MVPWTQKYSSLMVTTVWAAVVLGSLIGLCSSPRCHAAPSPLRVLAGSTASAAGGGAVATCTTSGGTVTNYSASGGGFASCYASSTTSSPPPAPPSRVPSSGSTLKGVIPAWALVSALIPLI